MIDIEPGYWQRAGALRAKALARQRKALLGDTSIAQTCIDRGISLLTRNRDFRTFGEAAGFDLVLGFGHRLTSSLGLHSWTGSVVYCDKAERTSIWPSFAPSGHALVGTPFHCL